MITNAKQKLGLVNDWLQSAISAAEADKTKLRPLSKPFCVRNVEGREACYDFAVNASAQGKIIPVNIRMNHITLYTPIK